MAPFSNSDSAQPVAIRRIPAPDNSVTEPFAAMFLQRLPNFGPTTYWKLVSWLGSAEALLSTPANQFASMLDPEALRLLANYQERRDGGELASQVQCDFQWCEERGVHILYPAHPSYPAILKEIHRPPFVLYASGNLNCLSSPQIAVVGSRNPTAGGRENAYEFAAFLAKSGFTISSGLALGVDAAAHRGALAVEGHTLAVLGTGIDTIYPRRHKSLAQQIIAEGGLILSEFPLGTSPNPGNFPQRNRIISGLSLGVLVVEAAPKSGSLITARFAMQQGREVFAIPGSIHNPLSRGCHALIRDGAALVETADDMLAELRGLLAFKREELTNADISSEIADIEDRERQLLEAVGHDPVSLEQLAVRLQTDVGDLMGQLIGLEIKDLIVQTPQGYQRRR